MPGPVFVSYSRHDQPYAMKLVEHLQEAGFEVWVDTEIHYGTRWENEVRRQIETAAAMVVVMTPDAERSEHVGNELIWARRLKIPILPVLLSGEGLFALSHRHHFDARDGSLPGRPFLTDLATRSTGPLWRRRRSRTCRSRARRRQPRTRACRPRARRCRPRARQRERAGGG